MSDDDVPVLVFEGEYAEVLFLKTLIESAVSGRPSLITTPGQHR